MKNWEGKLEKVIARLSKWKWLCTVVAWQVLVINYLTASTLWHRFIVMEPPDKLICRIQRALVDFFWSRQHWFRAAALYLPAQ